MAYQRSISDTIDVANLLLWNSSLNTLYAGGSSWALSGQRDALIGKYLRIPLSTRDLSTLNLSVFPNPSSDFILIRGPLDASTQLTVLDQEGRLIYQEKLNPGILNKKLNSASWARGVYMLRMENKNATATLQIIKN